MTELMRWEPMRELTSLRDAMDRLFEESFVRPSLFWSDNQIEFPVDMYQTEDSVVVKASLPGFKPEEVDISIVGDNLVIKGEHKEEKEVKEQDYIYRERRFGSVSRAIPLPAQIKADKADAVFENGVLTLTLPKTEEAKPKQIKIKAKALTEATKK